MTSSREWARQADAGDYLIAYATCGVDPADDAGSRCGYGDDELAEIDSILERAGLTLKADDIGLVAVAVVGWSPGDKVEAGEPGTEDYDTGRVMRLGRDRQIFVGWDSGVQTWTDASDLRSR
jgi:hypothetical protein